MQLYWLSAVNKHIKMNKVILMCKIKYKSLPNKNYTHIFNDVCMLCLKQIVKKTKV